MKNQIVSIIALSLFVGCASGTANETLSTNKSLDYTVYIDPSFSEDTGDVVAALNEWENATAERATKVHFNIVISDKSCLSSTCWHEISITNRYTTAELLANVPSCALADNGMGGAQANPGQWGSDWAYVYVAEDLTDSYSQNVIIRHELGHALGLEHIDANVIMCKDISCDAPHITCEDVNHLQVLNGSDEISCP